MIFDPERALPAAAYRDAAWLRAEMERIWRGDWVFAATEDAVAKPGDQLPLTIGGQPVLLLRNQAGKLVALSNLCAHRGTLLVEQATNAKRIQCPYHAWTYDDAGRLVGVPFAPKEAVDRRSHGLPGYGVASWHGLVFVSLDPDAEPLQVRLAAVESYLSEGGVDQFAHDSSLQSSATWACNWKVAIMNAMESYHLFKVHPETLEPYTPTKGAYYVAGSARATLTGGRSKGQRDYLLLSLPPGFVGVLTQDSFLWQAVQPLGADHCAVQTGGAYRTERRSRSRGKFARWIARLASAAYNASSDFLSEDKAICERIQRGVGGDFAPGRLVPIERVVMDFGHYLNWRLNGVEPPPVRIKRHAAKVPTTPKHAIAMKYTA